MTRDQLIERLLKFPADMDVVVSLPHHEEYEAGTPCLEVGWCYRTHTGKMVTQDKVEAERLGCLAGSKVIVL